MKQDFTVRTESIATSTGHKPLINGEARTEVDAAGPFIQPHVETDPPTEPTFSRFDSVRKALWDDLVAANARLGPKRLANKKFVEFVKRNNPSLRGFSTRGLVRRLNTTRASGEPHSRGPAVTRAHMKLWEQTQLDNFKSAVRLSKDELLDDVYSHDTHQLYNVHPATLEKALLTDPDAGAIDRPKPGLKLLSADEEARLNTLFESHERFSGPLSEIFYFKKIRNKDDPRYRDLAHVSWWTIRNRLLKFRAQEALLNDIVSAAAAGSPSSVHSEDIINELAELDAPTSHVRPRASYTTGKPRKKRTSTTDRTLTPDAAARLHSMVKDMTKTRTLRTSQAIHAARKAAPDVFGTLSDDVLRKGFARMDNALFMTTATPLTEEQSKSWNELFEANRLGAREPGSFWEEKIYSDPDHVLHQVDPKLLALSQPSDNDSKLLLNQPAGLGPKLSTAQIRSLRSLFAANETADRPREEIDYFKAIYKRGSNLTGIRPITLRQIGAQLVIWRHASFGAPDSYATRSQTDHAAHLGSSPAATSTSTSTSSPTPTPTRTQTWPLPPYDPLFNPSPNVPGHDNWASDTFAWPSTSTVGSGHHESPRFEFAESAFDSMNLMSREHRHAFPHDVDFDDLPI